MQKQKQRLIRIFDKQATQSDILLMEHGISSNLALSAAQKALNPLLYRIYGCHHPRDILGLVRASGLKIDSVDSYWLNMVHLVRASK